MDQPLRFGFIPIEGGSYYPEFLEEVLLGEALGFDSVWLDEHHGIQDHYWPSPLVSLAGIATCTERLRDAFGEFQARVVAIGPGLFKFPFPPSSAPRLPLGWMGLAEYENWDEALTLMRTELVIRESCGCRPLHSNDPQDEFLSSTRR